MFCLIEAGNKYTSACYVKLLVGFPLNRFLSQDGCQIHLDFKGMKRALTFRSLAVHCVTAHRIKKPWELSSALPIIKEEKGGFLDAKLPAL